MGVPFLSEIEAREGADLFKKSLKRAVVSSDVFSSPVEAQIRWNSTNKSIAWYTGTTEKSIYDITLNELTAPTANVSMNSNRLTSLADPVNPQDGATRAWVLANTFGMSRSFVVLHPGQLDSTNDAIAEALIVYLTSNPTAGEQITVTNTTGSQAFTAVASGAGANQFNIGVNAAATMQNMATSITGSLNVAAVYTTALTSVNSSCIIIYMTNQTIADRQLRVFGDLSNTQVVSFNGTTEYTNSSGTALPGVDPGAGSKQAGTSKITADLKANEVHATRTDDRLYAWNSDSTSWIDAGANTLIAGNGINISGVTVSVASDSTGGANLSRSINVSSNGVAVKIDDVTIGEDGSQRLYTKSVVARKQVVDVTGDGSTATFNVTHSSVTQDYPSISVWRDSTGKQEIVEVTRVSSTVHSIAFNTAPANGVIYHVMVIG